MDTQEIFNAMHRLHNELIAEIRTVEKGKNSVIELCETALVKIDAAIRSLKTQVVAMEFNCMADEIYFFKQIKPLFVSEWIYYSELLELESKKPVGGAKAVKSMYEEALEKLIGNSRQNEELYGYYRRNATYLDQKYFVRNVPDLKMQGIGNTHDRDTRFTTAGDQPVARFLADRRLENYIMGEIHLLKNPALATSGHTSALSWSASKASLVELIYGLHVMHCFNGGNIELSEIIRTFEKLFTVDLENFHKVLTEVKARKINRTKFLQSLHENLDRHFTDGDGIR